MAYTFLKHFRTILALALLISLLLLISAACNRQAGEQAPAAFDAAESQVRTLIAQLEMLGSDDIMQLEVRAGRLLLDQRVLSNEAAEESLRASLDFLSHIIESIDSLKVQVYQSREQIGKLHNEWLKNKEMRPVAMEQLFMEQQKLNDMLMMADYFVSRWNAQLMNIEAFEKAFPQNQNE